MSRNQISRRQFIKGAAISASVALASQNSGLEAQVKRTATDQVTLGKTGMRLSRLGIGTGTISGSVQRGLGREKFNALIQYAYDRGITYIDTSDSYQTHTWVRDAIRGLPREKLYIQSKILSMPGFGKQASTLETLDRFRKELSVDYINTVLIHCQIHPSWVEQTKSIQDALEEAKSKGIIRAHGVSCHSLPALKRAAELDWVDVNLVRINPQGAEMDTPDTAVFSKSNESNVPAVVEQLRTMRKNGHGTIGMKLVAQGQFTKIEKRKKSLTWVMQNNLVDAVVIGMKNSAEIDEAIMHINNAL